MFQVMLKPIMTRAEPSATPRLISILAPISIDASMGLLQAVSAARDRNVRLRQRQQTVTRKGFVAGSEGEGQANRIAEERDDEPGAEGDVLDGEGAHGDIGNGEGAAGLDVVQLDIQVSAGARQPLSELLHSLRGRSRKPVNSTVPNIGIDRHLSCRLQW